MVELEKNTSCLFKSMQSYPFAKEVHEAANNLYDTHGVTTDRGGLRVHCCSCAPTSANFKNFHFLEMLGHSAKDSTPGFKTTIYRISPGFLIMSTI